MPVRHPSLPVLALALTVALPAFGRIVDRVSAPADPLVLGRQGNSESRTGPARAQSADGRYVAFISSATNLVAGTTGENVYVADLQTSALRRITPSGTENVNDVTISGNGRYVAFSSGQDSLAPGDTNGTDDVYLHDTATSTLTRLSSTLAGTSGSDESRYPSLSSDGRYTVFESRAPELVAGDTDDNDVILYDHLAGSLALLAPTANEDTESPDISDNGRYVCYESTATNLVANDTNARGDVFRLDRTTGELLLVSRTPGGASGNGSSFGCDVADDGTVAFVSAATDLVAGAGRTDGAAYVYVPGQSSLVLVSVAADQSPANGPSRDVSISTDGSRIAFASSASNLPGPTSGAYEIYVRDRIAQQTHRISRATDAQVAPTQASIQPHIAAAGTSVVFESAATNLVAGDTNGSLDVFRYDYATQAMQRVSLAPAPLASGGGGGLPRVSGDGSLVVFLSNAPALLAGTGSTASQVFLYRRATRALTILTRNAQGQATREFGEEPVISADGRWVAYASRAADLAPGADTNGERDIHLHDVVAGTTVRISRTPAGNAPASGLARYPTISADGSRVVFFSTQAELGAVGLGSLFLWSRSDNSIRRIDLAADGSIGSSLLDGLEISGNGSKLAFRSLSNNLLPGVGNGFYQMYRKDLDSGALELVSHAPDGSQANGGSVAPSISHDGNVVAFTSFASNLVAGDDANEDLFVTNFAAGGAVTRVTPGGTGGAIIASLSADARFLAFRSARTNLVPNDTNGVTDIFVYDRTLQTFARASVDAQRQQLAGATNAPRLSADGGWIAMTIDPGSGIVVPGRPAAIRNDVLLGINPQVELFSSGFE